MNGTAVAGQHGLKREPAAGLQDPGDLGKKRQLVGDIHQHVLRPHHIERMLREEQRCGTALDEVADVGHAQARRQHLRGAHELSGQINTC